MRHLIGKYYLAIGSIFLFFALVKSEFFLWENDASTASLTYNPVPFIVGAVVFMSLSAVALKRTYQEAKQKNEEPY
jgi:hypothetical protein